MTCSEKTIYESKAEADAFAATVRDRKLTSYQCACGKWHLTKAQGFVLAHRPVPKQFIDYTKHKGQGFSNGPRIA